MKTSIIFLLTIPLLFICCQNNEGQKTQVVATNSWTAAFAQAAGATNIVVLAPFEMEHPSEYELRPGDIPKVANASIILYAGYENMVDRLNKGLNIPDEKLLQIETSYRFAAIEKSVMSIANKLGTEDIAQKNLDEIRTLLIEGKNKIEKEGVNKNPILVHYFQESLAVELGIHPVALFGPAPPEAAEIAKFAHSGASLILDNIHNPVGSPIKEVLPNSKLLLLLNFPGKNQTRTLSDVIRYDIQQIVGEQPN